MKEFFFVIPEEYNEQGNAMSDVTYLSIGASWKTFFNNQEKKCESSHFVPDNDII